MVREKSINLPLDVRQLGSRVGDRASWQRTLVSARTLGTADLYIPAERPIDVEIAAIALEEGVSITVEGWALAEGNCVRCLEGIQRQIAFSRTEIYYYPQALDRLKKQIEKESIEESKREDPLAELEDFDQRYQFVDSTRLDLEPLLIDAIVPQIPYTVLCEDDCPGLCPKCGIRLAEAEPEHEHDEIDPRLAVLSQFFTTALPADEKDLQEH